MYHLNRQRVLAQNLIWKIPARVNITDCLPTSIFSFLHNNIPVLFIWFRKKLPHFQFQKWDPINPGQSKKSKPLSVNALGMNMWPNFCLAGDFRESSFLSLREQDRSQLRLSRDMLLPLAAGCYLRPQGKSDLRLGRRGQRFREKEPWTYHKQNLSTPDFKRSESKLFPTTTCMMVDVIYAGHSSKGVSTVCLCVIPRILKVTSFLSNSIKHLGECGALKGYNYRDSHSVIYQCYLKVNHSQMSALQLL